LNKVRFPIKPLGKRSFLLILTSIMLLMMVLLEVGQSQSNETEKEKVVHQVAQKWIQVGTEQYQRGMYKAAEQSFLRAKDYREYLTADELSKLDELLTKSKASAVEKDRISGLRQKADQLANQGQLAEAKATLEEVVKSELLTQEEREQVTKNLAEINSRLDAQKKSVPEVSERSPETDKTPAEKPNISMPAETKPAEQYLVAVAKSSELAEQDKQEKKETAVVAAEPDSQSYIGMVNQKRAIRQSHTKAVVDNAIAKAETHLSRNEFDKANETVQTAIHMVNKNRSDLGDELFVSYTNRLSDLTGKIKNMQAEAAKQTEQQKEVESAEVQRNFREQMDVDRQKRVNELMNNAIAYQKSQRYEEALGQIESLLAIDPLNDRALILKQTLDDMISFRKQLEVQKEAGKEKVDILIKTDEAGTPYAEDITHPKNWREIVAKATRKPEEAIGQDPANAAVMKTLEQIVDLSKLTPEMPISEAVDEIKNSVTPPLKIVVLWRDLVDNAEIDQTTPINMDGMAAVPVGTALKLLLESVSGGMAKLSYVVENGVIKIATEESLKEELVPLVYDVSVLVGRPANFYASTGGGTTGGGGGGGGGGGSGGGGGQGGGGGGAGIQYFAEYFDVEEEEEDKATLQEEARARMDALIQLIQNTVEPDSWFDAGGKGTIMAYESKKIIVRQTRQIQSRLQTLLAEMRKSLGHQVAIEARFLIVGENFLEDIGLDLDFSINTGSSFNIIDFQQNSSGFVEPAATGVPGSMGTIKTATGSIQPQVRGLTVSGHGIMDDLTVNFLLRATQAHKDAKSLTAPKVTVLSGESATIRVQRTIRYALPPDVSGGYGGYGGVGGGGGGYVSGLTQNYGQVLTGTVLNITPTITPDKKHVLLNIVAELRGFLGFETSVLQVPTGIAGQVSTYTVSLPQTEISRVKTRVNMPDSGTLLLGGQKITEEVEAEAGVPILSKIPVLGRAFENRSKIKDNKILLILVKPTIILEEEADAEAIAAMEGAP